MPIPARKPKLQMPSSEAADQEIIAQYLNIKGILWFHPANEGKRTPWYAAKLKRQGLLAGVSDCVIMEPPPLHPDARGVLIELKRAKGGVVSESQVRFFALAEPLGWMCKICFGADEALDYLRSIGW